MVGITYVPKREISRENFGSNENVKPFGNSEKPSTVSPFKREGKFLRVYPRAWPIANQAHRLKTLVLRGLAAYA